MGNCLFLQPPVTWVDDDEEDDDGELCVNSANLIKKQEADGSSICRKGAIAAATTKVRVRISKKQLEELLRRAEVKGLSTKDVMLDIINMSLGNSCGSHGHHWRPVLNSIAEEPEHASGFNHSHPY